MVIGSFGWEICEREAANDVRVPEKKSRAIALSRTWDPNKWMLVSRAGWCGEYSGNSLIRSVTLSRARNIPSHPRHVMRAQNASIRESSKTINTRRRLSGRALSSRANRSRVAFRGNERRKRSWDMTRWLWLLPPLLSLKRNHGRSVTPRDANLFIN